MIFTTIASLLLAQISCDVQLMNGTSQSGELAGLTVDRVMLATAADTSTLDLEDVHSIAVLSEKKVASSDEVVELTDGSRVFTDRATGNLKSCQIGKVGSGWVLDSAVVRSVRFRTGASRIDNQWEDIAALPLRGDVLVIRKGNNSLDYLEGLVEGYDEEQVHFRFEDDLIEVKKQKLEGILFFHGEAGDPAEPRVVAGLRDGTILRGSQVYLENGELAIETVCGFRTPVPIADVKLLNYGIGKVAYLSDLEPSKVSVTPLFGSVLQESLNKLIYSPRKNIGFGKAALEIHNPKTGETREYRKGLAIHSRTEMSWRLSGRYRQLRGVVGAAPGNASGASAQLVVRADDQILVDEIITSATPPVELDVSIGGAKRLDIVIDYGDGSDVADRVHCCDLRVIK